MFDQAAQHFGNFLRLNRQRFAGSRVDQTGFYTYQELRPALPA
jgi:hypothetical protein